MVSNLVVNFSLDLHFFPVLHNNGELGVSCLLDFSSYSVWAVFYIAGRACNWWPSEFFVLF